MCQIDFKKNEKLKILACHDRFHKKCLIKWVQKKGTCPICNLKLA